MHILNKLNRQLHVYIPVSLRRSIAADNSLTHPRNADGDTPFHVAAETWPLGFVALSSTQLTDKAHVF